MVERLLAFLKVTSTSTSLSGRSSPRTNDPKIPILETPNCFFRIGSCCRSRESASIPVIPVWSCTLLTLRS
jgi:hypothetical protein